MRAANSHGQRFETLTDSVIAAAGAKGSKLHVERSGRFISFGTFAEDRMSRAMFWSRELGVPFVELVRTGDVVDAELKRERTRTLRIGLPMVIGNRVTDGKIVSVLELSSVLNSLPSSTGTYSDYPVIAQRYHVDELSEAVFEDAPLTHVDPFETLHSTHEPKRVGTLLQSARAALKHFGIAQPHIAQSQV